MRAEARAVAEARVFTDNPEKWLEGPGAQTGEPDADNWAEPSGPSVDGSAGPPVVYLHGILTPEKWQELYGTPEARRQLTMNRAAVAREDKRGLTTSDDPAIDVP